MSAQKVILLIIFFIGSLSHAAPILYEQDTRAPITEIKIVFHCGQAIRKSPKSSANLLAFEALLRGTKSMTAKEWNADLEALGASVSTRASSLTSSLKLEVLSENFEKALALVGDAIFTPAFNPGEVEIIRNRHLGGLLDLKLDSYDLTIRAFRKFLYAGTNSAVPINGTVTDTKSLTADDLRKTYETECLSKNMTFLVASNLPLKTIEPALNSFYDRLPGTEPARFYPELPAPKFGEKTLITIARPDAKQAQFGIAIPGIVAASPDRLSLEIGNLIFGGSSQAILFEELRSKKGWLYYVGSGFDFLDYLNLRPEPYAMSGNPQVEVFADAINKTLELAEDFFTKGPTPEKFTIASNFLRKSYPFEVETAEARLQKRLVTKLFHVPYYSFEEFSKKLAAQKPADVLKAMQKNFDLSKAVIVAIGDPKSLAQVKKKVKFSKHLEFKPDDLLK